MGPVPRAETRRPRPDHEEGALSGRVADALVDTDVLVDHLRGRRRLDPVLTLAYSVVTRAELFAGSDSLRQLRALLDSMLEVPIDRAIAEGAGAIRRQTGIALPDALIAATAIRLNVPLLTRNARHFRTLPGLHLV